MHPAQLARGSIHQKKMSQIVEKVHKGGEDEKSGEQGERAPGTPKDFPRNTQGRL